MRGGGGKADALVWHSWCHRDAQWASFLGGPCVCVCARALFLSLSRRCSAHVTYFFFFSPPSRYSWALKEKQRNGSKRREIARSCSNPLKVSFVFLTWPESEKNGEKKKYFFFPSLIQHPVFVCCIFLSIVCFHFSCNSTSSKMDPNEYNLLWTSPKGVTDQHTQICAYMERRTGSISTHITQLEWKRKKKNKNMSVEK